MVIGLVYVDYTVCTSFSDATGPLPSHLAMASDDFLFLTGVLLLGFRPRCIFLQQDDHANPLTHKIRYKSLGEVYSPPSCTLFQ
jgi:hypothetical protein